MLDRSITGASNGGAAEAPAPIWRSANEEAELKFLAPVDALERVREAPAIARHARNGGTVRHLETVYYDTPDRALFAHGLSLRVRRSGRRFVQTLKRGPIHGEPFVRGEWETSVSSMAPDLTVLPVAEIGSPLDGIASQAFDPVFTTKVHRRTQQLGYSGAVIEVAFDDGVIKTGERSEPLTEIELEVKAGDTRVLYDLGLQLLEIAPLRIGIQSKSDRGYALAFGVSPQSTKATAPSITAEHTVDDVIGLLLASCQHHLLANQPIAEAGHNPEGVHQMRVAMRRLRTISTLLQRQLGLPSLEVFNAEAKWLGTQLGAARDWDVFITDTLRAPSAALGHDVDFDGLRQAAEPHRRAAYADLHKALVSPRYNGFQLSMRRWIASRGWRSDLQGRPLAVLLEPAADFARRSLTQLHHKALRKGAHFRHLQPEARHKVRIALKKLRYAGEFFRTSSGVDGEAKAFLSCVANLQDALGHDNDASTTAPLLSTLERDQLSHGVHRTLGVVMGWQARDRLDHARTLRKQWQHFKAMTPFW